MKRALVVAFHFAPENTSGTHRSLHFARRLVDEGIEVTVLSRSLASLSEIDPTLDEVFPWPDRIVRVAEQPTRLDRVVAASRRVLGRDGAVRATSSGRPGTKTGPAARRSPGPDSAKRFRDRRFGAARSFLDWSLRFPDVHKGWYGPAVSAGTSIIRRDSFDLVFASGPPWTGLRVGARLSREGGIPFIADYRDPWTRRTGRTWDVGGRLFDQLAAGIEGGVIRTAALTTTNSPGISDAIRAGYPNLDGVDVVTILNGSDARRRTADCPFQGSTGLVARHFGSLYAGRRISPLLAAMAERSREGSAWRAEQYGPAPAAADIEGLDPAIASMLTVRAPVEFHRAVDRMHEPAVLVMIQPAILSRQVPTKLYDYLCSGNPVLVLATERSAAWQVARRFERAFRADPDDAAAISRTLAAVEDLHRSGDLRQVATGDDTAVLSKQAIGTEFIEVASRVAGQATRP